MVFKEIQKEQARLKKEIKQKTISYLLAAFGFVAGLAWNEAIKSFIDQFFPDNKNSILIKFIYAISITIVMVIITVYLLKKPTRKNKSQEK